MVEIEVINAAYHRTVAVLMQGWGKSGYKRCLADSLQTVEANKQRRSWCGGEAFLVLGQMIQYKWDAYGRFVVQESGRHIGNFGESMATMPVEAYRLACRHPSCGL